MKRGHVQVSEEDIQSVINPHVRWEQGEFTSTSASHNLTPSLLPAPRRRLRKFQTGCERPWWGCRQQTVATDDDDSRSGVWHVVSRPTSFLDPPPLSLSPPPSLPPLAFFSPPPSGFSHCLPYALSHHKARGVRAPARPSERAGFLIWRTRRKVEDSLA